MARHALRLGVVANRCSSTFDHRATWAGMLSLSRAVYALHSAPFCSMVVIEGAAASMVTQLLPPGRTNSTCLPLPGNWSRKALGSDVRALPFIYFEVYALSLRAGTAAKSACSNVVFSEPR
eukprot:TRINITY_DN16716_c0_g1_i1.p1 TRINITY_DN16716_c0_g1~~TRINITY_DN16716_c0_g1_i1.p1  ORF type:complete len:121 (-),score=8.22 TRINITY_DN16716_c0_g1_i1:19-381(-)